MELIDKATVVTEIKGYISNYKEIVAKTNRNDSTWVDSVSMIDAKIDVLQHVLFFLNTLEVKEVKEEPVNEDLEDYAKKESESFAEREYEIDYIDRNALAKGYYWGVKAGAEWLAGQGETLYDTINVDGKNQRWLGENLLYGDYNAGQAVIVQIRKL